MVQAPAGEVSFPPWCHIKLSSCLYKLRALAGDGILLLELFLSQNEAVARVQATSCATPSLGTACHCLVQIGASCIDMEWLMHLPPSTYFS